MNVQAIVVGDADLAGVDTEALVLVTSAAHKARANGTPAEQLIAAAVKSGDLAMKAGQTLYLHSPAGLKARQIGRAHV